MANREGGENTNGAVGQSERLDRNPVISYFITNLPLGLTGTLERGQKIVDGSHTSLAGASQEATRVTISENPNGSFESGFITSVSHLNKKGDTNTINLEAPLSFRVGFLPGSTAVNSERVKKCITTMVRTTVPYSQGEGSLQILTRQVHEEVEKKEIYTEGKKIQTNQLVEREMDITIMGQESGEGPLRPIDFGRLEYKHFEIIKAAVMLSGVGEAKNDALRKLECKYWTERIRNISALFDKSTQSDLLRIRFALLSKPDYVLTQEDLQALKAAERRGLSNNNETQAPVAPKQPMARQNVSVGYSLPQSSTPNPQIIPGAAGKTYASQVSAMN